MCVPTPSSTQPIFTIVPVFPIFSQKTLVQFGGAKIASADIDPHFAAIDIERGDDFDVVRPIGPDLLVHQADACPVARRAAIETDSLDQRARRSCRPRRSRLEFYSFEAGRLAHSLPGEQARKC